MLWLCLHLPRLPLEARGEPAPDRSARGQAPGATPARDARAERAALEGVAAWAYQFSDRLAIEARERDDGPFCAVLVELAGSVTLFGGLAALLARIAGALPALGYTHRLGLAPTPSAAEALARAGVSAPVTALAELPARLAPLPLAVLDVPAGMVAALRGVGVRTVGECLALPRDQLARRFGPHAVDVLRRLLGERADVRLPYEPPTTFRRRFEFAGPLTSIEGLLFPLRRLLHELQGLLIARDGAVLRLTLHLAHEEHAPTALPLNLAAPRRDAPALLPLWRERLERAPLPAPVTALELVVDEFAPGASGQRDFFDDRARLEESTRQLVERLAARLGPQAVRAALLRDDYRPEKSFAERSIAQAPSGPGADVKRPRDSFAAANDRKIPGSVHHGTPARPLWLLPAPRALRAPPPQLSRPERIETGWWDGGGVARDYYVAETPGGSRLWVFRERDQWFLHGVWARRFHHPRLTMRYAELHCLSNFSFLRGASHADELVQRARELGYAALAITDECSLAGIVRAHQAAKACGLKLIVGAELVLADGLALVVLAQNHDGYTRLCQLITQARRRSAKGQYRVTRDDLADGLPHCLVLWLPSRTADVREARSLAACFAGRLWIAAQLHREAEDAARAAQLATLAAEAGLPVVAAGGVHMHARERKALQDVVTAIRHGCTVADAGGRLFANAERHLRALPDLAQVYPREWLEESARIADRCTFTLDELRYEYPHELVPAGTTAAQHLRALTEAGARRRWPAGPPPPVRALIEKELALVHELGYEHFFLTVHDLVAFAKGRGILCQGRGSAANSAVCFALGITEVDPARMNMLFERFISKERNEPPDIDVDFEHERREEVIQYVYAKYGRHRTALAATVICYRPKSAIRDVGKALGFTPDEVDRLAGSHAWWEGTEALPARLAELGFDTRSLRVRHLLYCVKHLLGAPRHLSQHVGGFVISERPLSALVPIENAAMPERTIIQWDKDDLEALGLLKVDCLALGMLTAIRKTLDLVNGFAPVAGAPHGRDRPGQDDGLQEIGRAHGALLQVANIPAEDPKTYDMICAAKTMGVFQIESRAQMTMLPRLRPRNFYDLVIEVAIVRPGPIQGKMVHPYLRRRNGEEPVEYPSEDLKRVLGRTLGVPIFQEQVMQIAVVAAGFTPGEADQLRRAMAAWKRNGGIEPFHARLMRGMAERGYTPEFSEQIYQQLRGFADYGFPESHSASFALLVYVSAWLRCHHLAAFTAGLLNSQPMGFYPPTMLVREAQRCGVEVRPVDVTRSDWDCTLEPGAGGAPALRLGLRQISGLPEAAAAAIVAARRAQPFAGVDDLVHRARLDERARRLLAGADALASLAGHRHRARWRMLGAERLPGFLDGRAAAETPPEFRAPREGEEIAYDYQAMGLTLRRHPVALLRPRLARARVLRAADLEALPTGRIVRVGGIVMFRQRPGTASGTVFVSLEDETGVVNLIVWPRVVEAQRAPLLQSRLLLVEGELQKEGGVTHVVARELRDRSAWLGRIDAPSRDFH